MGVIGPRYFFIILPSLPTMIVSGTPNMPNVTADTPSKSKPMPVYGFPNSFRKLLAF